MKRKLEKRPEFTIKRLAIMAACCVTLSAALGFSVLAYYFAPRKTNAQTVTVPYLVGMRWSDVRAGESFFLSPEYVYSEDAGEGEIVSQSPMADSVRKIGEGERLEIKVKVSLGKKTDKLPRVAGMPYVAAAISLREIGADVVVMPVFDSEEKVGTVISTDPPEQTKISAGQRVVMYVARGRVNASVLVPSLVGMDADEACVELLGAGLKLGEIKDEKGNGAQAGTVVAQSIAQGMYVRYGTYIDLTVSAEQNKGQIEDNESGKEDIPWWHFGLW